MQNFGKMNQKKSTEETDVYILDENKNPVPVEDVKEWALMFDRDERVVDKTTTKSGHYVSTVFLGLDHSWVENKIEIFETMIFSEDKDVDEYQERYSTWKEAQEGHNRIVKSLDDGSFVSLRKKLTLNLKQNN